ncbi:MAG: hypothetical protein FIA97_10040 [Methylococcaceae bacterium]|nr:hypothetical protein [Methylococcaceae bacterium]
MRTQTLTASLFLTLALTSVPSMAVVDEDFMQTVEDTHKSLTSNLAVQNAESSNVDAKLLEGYFVEIEDHFVKKGDAQDGVELSKKSRDLILDIEKTIAANDFDTASKFSAELGRTCKACHKIYDDE